MSNAPDQPFLYYQGTLSKFTIMNLNPYYPWIKPGPEEGDWNDLPHDIQEAEFRTDRICTKSQVS